MNVVLNFLLVSPFGVYGVITTLIITYLVLVTYRWFDTKRYFKLTLNRGIITPIVIALATSVPFYLSTAIWQDALTMVVAIGLMVYFCPKRIRKDVFGKIYAKLHASA